MTAADSVRPLGVRTPRPPPVIALRAIGAAAVLVATGVVLLATISEGLEQPYLRAGLIVLVSLPYVLSGMVAWRRRPESSFGPLLIVAGFALALTTLQWASAAIPYTVGGLLDLVPAVIFPHVFLAFPSGRLERRPERVLITVGYVAAVGGSMAVLLLGGFDPRNLLAVVQQPGLAESVQNA